VGRTSMAWRLGRCWHGPGGSGEAVGDVPAWTRRRWRWCGIEVGVEEEQAHGVDLVAVREVPAWAQWQWRQSRSGRAGGGEIKPPEFGFKGQPCN
jgi:hypothetical protein